jgi:two-component system, chemotaxis family, sensor kinase CheA
MGQVDLSRFRDTFFEEAAEHTATIEQSLLAVEEAADQRDVLDAIFRAAHSIKGASGVFGLTAVMQFTHGLESVLDRLREGTLACDRSTIDLLLSANDVLKHLLDAAQANEAPPESMTPVLAALNALVGAPETHAGNAQGDSSKSQAHAHGVIIRFRPSADILRQGLDPLVLFRELSELGELTSVTLETNGLPDLGAFDPETCYLYWTIVLHTTATVSAVRDVFLFAEDGAELDVQPLDQPAASTSDSAAPSAAASIAASTAAPTVTPTAPPPAAEERRTPGDRRRSLEGASLRVPTQKVDRLIDLVGEIAIAQSIVTNLIDSFTPGRLGQLRDAVAFLERNTRELQERVMGIRMVPIGGVFSRFPRLVRDVAAGLAKDVRVEMIGEDTELDKVVVERIGDPLTHLVRNAVDHGLEPPDARVAAGKPAEGLIRLGAYTRGGAVVIEVEDDGRGLDTERIRAKALAQGLITASQNLTTEALHQLIFEPGFSTAAAVSDLSGRGVGMDVVKRNVEELNGTVTVDSRPGRGTCVRISLPLTLAIMDGQSLAIGNTVYVLPLTAIVESLRPKRGDVTTVLGTGEVVRVRGDAVPLVRLHRCFGVTPTHVDPCDGIVVLVEHRGRRAALLVDELRGQHQVVIKSLDAHYRRVEGVMGATIMGDGSVALILDAPGLLRMSESQARAHAAPAA